MKKCMAYIAGLFLALGVCVFLLSFETGAVDGAAMIYVQDGGSGTGQSADSPLGSLSAAVDALDGKGGSIVVCGKLSIRAKTTIPEQSSDLSIVAIDGGYISLSARLQFAKNANDQCDHAGSSAGRFGKFCMLHIRWIQQHSFW